MEKRFDPMTGEPIVSDAPANEQMSGYQPMQEQSVMSDYQPMQKQAVMSDYQSMQEQPGMSEFQSDYMAQPAYVITQQPKKKKGALIGVICAVVALVVILGGALVVCAKNGVFLSKEKKVALAIKNTFEDAPQFMKDLSFAEWSDVKPDDNYTVDIEASMQDAAMELSVINTKSRKQLIGEIGYQGVSTDVLMEINEEKVMVQVPIFSGDVFVYDYKDDHVSDFLKEALKEADLEPKDLNSALETLFIEGDVAEKDAELEQKFVEKCNELVWTDAEQKSFTIDGESRKAKGYELTITREDAGDFMEILGEYVRDSYEGDTEDLRESMDELYSLCRTMPDVTLAFYIYKNKLASIELETSDGFEMELLFKGGESRMQNMMLNCTSKEGTSLRFELEGSVNGTQEEYSIYAFGMEIGTIEYNTGNGRYTIHVAGNTLVVDGRIISEKDESGFTVNVGSELNMEVLYKKGAELEEIEGRERVINDMKEEDWMELFMNLDTF